MRGAGELTAEASKLLALKAELKAELSDDHGWAPVESVLSPPCPPRLSSAQVHTDRSFPGSATWVSESPLDEGQSKQGQTRSEPHSGGCRCPLSIPLVRFSSECSCGSAGTSLFQPAREARCPSAATLTVSSSPAPASQVGQGHSPHGPDSGKYPRRSQHHPLCPLHTCHGLLRPGREGPGDHSSRDTHPGPRMGFCPARSRTLRDCKMNVTPVVSSMPVSGGSQPQYKAVLTELWPCLPSKAWKTLSSLLLLRKIRTGPADPTRGKGPAGKWHWSRGMFRVPLFVCHRPGGTLPGLRADNTN